MTVYARGHDGWMERLNRQPDPQTKFNWEDEHELASLDGGQQGGHGDGGECLSRGSERN